MDALLTSFVAAALAAFGDKAQLLVAALAARHRRPLPILAALLAAAAISSGIAAVAGTFVHDMITLRAIALMVALSFITAGVGGLASAGAPTIQEPSHIPLFPIATVCLLAAEVGGKSQFTTFALAAHYDAAWLTAVGATAGIFAVGLPAAILGDRLVRRLPIKLIRYLIAGLFLVAGAVTAVNALRLV